MLYENVMTRQQWLYLHWNDVLLVRHQYPSNCRPVICYAPDIISLEPLGLHIHTFTGYHYENALAFHQSQCLRCEDVLLIHISSP